MRADFETIHVARHDDHILLVTLNRPEASNALNTRMGLDLVEVFETFSIDLAGPARRCYHRQRRQGVLRRRRSERAQRHDRRELAGAASDTSSGWRGR